MQNTIKVYKLSEKATDILRECAHILWKLFFGQHVISLYRGEKREYIREKFCSVGAQDCGFDGPTLFIAWIRKILLDFVIPKTHNPAN